MSRAPRTLVGEFAAEDHVFDVAGRGNMFLCGLVSGHVDVYRGEVTTSGGDPLKRDQQEKPTPGASAYDGEKFEAPQEDFGLNFSLTRRLKKHTGGVRSLAFGSDENQLMTVSSDGTALLSDFETGKRVHRFTFGAGTDPGDDALPLNVVLPLAAGSRNGEPGASSSSSSSSALWACGDDNGGVHILDVRSKKRVFKNNEQEDYVSDLLFHNQQLCCTSGDGTLAVYDLRKNLKLYALSDPQDDELLSLSLHKAGKKLIVGTALGDIRVFTWDDWGDCKDRILLPKQIAKKQNMNSNNSAKKKKSKGGGAGECGSMYGGGGGGFHSSELTQSVTVDALVKYDEDLAIAGGGDGHLRLVSVHGPKHGNVVFPEALASHKEGMGVESLKPYQLDLGGHFGKKRFFASASSDHVVRIWDLEKSIESRLGAALTPHQLVGKKAKRNAGKRRRLENPDDLEERGAGGFFGDL